MTRVFLFRHGEVEKPEQHHYFGRTELPLTEYGQQQFRNAALFLRRQKITRILSSPLERCRLGAKIIAGTLHCPVLVHNGLAELDPGDWEGLSTAEVKKRFPGEYEARGRDMAHYTLPNGESFAELQARAWPVLEDCLQQRENSVIIAHAGVNRALLCRFLEIPLARLFLIGQDYGHYSTLCHSPSGKMFAKCINCRVQEQL